MSEMQLPDDRITANERVTEQAPPDETLPPQVIPPPPATTKPAPGPPETIGDLWALATLRFNAIETKVDRVIDLLARVIPVIEAMPATLAKMHDYADAQFKTHQDQQRIGFQQHNTAARLTIIEGGMGAADNETGTGG